jgi:copper chaperone CopZ
VSVAVQKLDGVESVEVSLERAVADIRLKPGNTVSIDKLREIVTTNGFAPRESVVTAVGRLIDRGGTPAIELSPSTTLVLAADPANAAPFTELAGRSRSATPGAVEVIAVVKENARASDPAIVRSSKPR